MERFSSIYVFGDGLCDMGQWGVLTNNLYPPANLGFHEGRWTNGKVWVEILADSLNLPISFKNNFAMGGATTGFYNINEPLKELLKLKAETKLTGMSSQVQEFLEGEFDFDDKT